MGRKHIYHLESFIRALVVQKLLGIPTDALLISLLRLCAEFRDFCGFDKVPDASQLTRFRDQYSSFSILHRFLGISVKTSVVNTTFPISSRQYRRCAP
ncbi:MAG: transposase [Clostridia bacterium]|nr:transposase [Oscillospiraceae bacterium]MBQ6347890.1 transposase [Clostridia bacterium]